MQQEIYRLPGFLTGVYHRDINAIIDTWESLKVSLEDFKSVVYNIGIDFAQKNDVTTWIVDNSNSHGVYKKEVQVFVESTLAPACARIGIRFFFVVLPQSDLGKLSAKKVAKINEEQTIMQTIEVDNLQEALDLLRKVQ